MSKPGFNDSQGKPDEMFDFLDEAAANRAGRASNSRRRRQFEMPIIRKPVPIAKSGPMNLESGALVSELDFLDDTFVPHGSESVHMSDDWHDGVYIDDTELPITLRRAKTRKAYRE